MRKDRLLIRYFCSLLIAGVTVLAHPVQAGTLEKLFAPKAKLWAYWTNHDKTSNRTIDHSQWGLFLARYVRREADGITRVDYSGVSHAHHVELKSYIESMRVLPISNYSTKEQFAFWVNLYNALTVDLVLSHYPVESIRAIKLSGGLFSKGPWSKKLLIIEGNEVSLNDIEHRILRPIWQDPRIHYALNCAAMGCPNLIAEPFTADNSERLLQTGAHDYINHPRGARIEDGRLRVSSIYVWFESDFGGDEAGVIAHLEQYAEMLLAVDLKGVKKISDDSYDWSLNHASR